MIHKGMLLLYCINVSRAQAICLGSFYYAKTQSGVQGVPILIMVRAAFILLTMPGRHRGFLHDLLRWRPAVIKGLSLFMSNYGSRKGMMLWKSYLQLY